MTKTKKQDGKKKQRGPRLPRSLVNAVVAGRDRMAEAYMQLLVDPCNAPLTYPLYGGSDGSYLAKFESYITVGAASKNGFLWWSPGTVCASAKSFLVTGTAATSSTGIVWATGTLDLAGGEPGAVFLRGSTSQAAAYRAVAACMEVTTLDTELNRQGQLAVGCCNNSAVYSTDTTIDKLQPLVPTAMRVPDSKLEAVWHPSDAAHMYMDANNTAAAQQIERHNGLLLTWVGLPETGAGLRIKLTLVAEWKPEQGRGIVAPTPPPQSRMGLADVMRFVSENSSKFVRVGQTAAAMYGAFRQQQRIANRGHIGRIEL